jgi:integrase-like protein
LCERRRAGFARLSGWQPVGNWVASAANFPASLLPAGVIPTTSRESRRTVCVGKWKRSQAERDPTYHRKADHPCGGVVFYRVLRGVLGTAPRSPWQNSYVERLIGTIRRECLDHIIVFGEAHLRRFLGRYAAYYNESRIHRSVEKDAPFHRTIERLGVIISRPALGGLHHQYCRI